MRFVDGRVVYAASDLNDFLVCPHRVALRRDALHHGIRPPDDDPTLQIVARKGREHERAMLERFVATGVQVTEIPADDGSPVLLAAAVAATRAAMDRGDPIIYQAAFMHDGWTGRADFLERVEQPSELGGWSYHVSDAKLALREKAPFLVQLCLYAEFVAAIQGRMPGVVRAIFGDGSQMPYDPSRYLPYVRAAKRRFCERIESLAAADVPERIGACNQCPWSERCDDARRRVDHLSLVASIRRSQIERLRADGIHTLAQLAQRSPEAVPRGMNSFPTLQRQARLQLVQRTTGKHEFELLPQRDGSGFELLPKPDPYDVYFDMEGDPLYEAGAGLEYLFGAYTNEGNPPYRHDWGETREAERRTFERFVDWLMQHRRDYPRAHVYHYAPYERSALRRLAMRHATREDEVDALLRDQAFVDLFAVVRGALAQSQESYSIKKLEPFYGFARSTDVRKGDQSIIAFEEYLSDRDPGKRDDIIAYNREDCESTAQLHAWLLRIRPAETRWRGEIEVAEERADPGDAERLEVERALLNGARPDEPRALAAHLLAYHRREAKPVCWALYERSEGDIDFVHDDNEALGGLVLSDDHAHAPVLPARTNGRTEFTYTFPPQQHKLGRDPVDPATRKSPGTVKVDEEARLVRISLSTKAPHPKALIPGWPLKTKSQAAALLRFGRAVLDGTVRHKYSAGWDILTRATPRITGFVEGTIVQPVLRAGEEAIASADVADLVMRLDRSALVVQGPPGSGKTYVGAHVIAALVAAGKRVGITSTGHKAIGNLLRELETVIASSGKTFRAVKKCDRGSADTQFVSEHGFVENEPDYASFAEYDVVAGTAWVFVHPELAPVDVLVVDEAGQFALADAVAVSTKAESVVLLGDPLQLAHVSQGVHPEGVGSSVLTHIVGEGLNVAPDRGIFLDRSFRMHPSLTAFVSTMAYEGRLESVPSCARQRIDAQWFWGAGLRYVPIEHAGNEQSSDAEAHEVVRIVEGLIGGTFTDRHGRTRPITLDDVLIVAPYNAHVRLLGERMRERFGPGARIGTVDKFQGQEAAAVIYSLAASSAEEAPRGPDFLFEENRFNVAVSRGRALAVVVCSPRLLEAPCATVGLLRSVAAFCAFAEAAIPLALSAAL